VAWAMRKFKRFNGSTILAGRFFERLVAADKAASLGRCKSFRRQLPVSGG